MLFRIALFENATGERIWRFNVKRQFMEYFDHARWASAIAKRISDEWSGASDFPQDVVLLRKSLEKMLSNDLDVVTSLIGTGVIENDYFDKLV